MNIYDNFRNNNRAIVIPNSKPYELFRYKYEEFSFFYSIPAITTSHILIPVGYFGPHQPGSIYPILVTLDRQTGQEALRVEVVGEGYDEIYAGLPAVQKGGDIFLPVHELDFALKVLHINSAGQILQEDELGFEDGQDKRSEMDIINHDMGNKVRIAPLALVAQDAYLISWLYRQRRYRTVCRRMGQKESVWNASEWMLGATENMVFGVTTPNVRMDYIEDFVLGPYKPDLSNYNLNAREKMSGKIVWSLPAAHKVLAAVHPQGCIIVDRSLRVLANSQRRETFETTWITQADINPNFPNPDIYAVDFNQEYPLTAPSVLMMIAPETGKELWNLKLDGDVVSVVCGPKHICLLVVAENGIGRVVCLDLDGQILWNMPVKGNAYWDYWPPDAYKWPVLIGLDDKNLLWGTPTELICSSLFDEGEMKWQLELPKQDSSVIYGKYFRWLDRHINNSNIVVGDQIILMRYGETVWAYSSNIDKG